MTDEEIDSTLSAIAVARTVAMIVGPLVGFLGAFARVNVEHDWYLAILGGAALLGYAVAWLSTVPLRALGAIVSLLRRLPPAAARAAPTP